MAQKSEAVVWTTIYLRPRVWPKIKIPRNKFGVTALGNQNTIVTYPSIQRQLVKWPMLLKRNVYSYRSWWRCPKPDINPEKYSRLCWHVSSIVLLDSKNSAYGIWDQCSVMGVLKSRYHQFHRLRCWSVWSGSRYWCGINYIPNCALVESVRYPQSVTSNLTLWVHWKRIIIVKR